MMSEKRGTGREERRCLICGQNAGEHKLCERCRESLSLCDVENWVARKLRCEKCGAPAANAFK